MSQSSRLRAVWRLASLAALAALLSPVQAQLVRRAPRRADALARWYHRRMTARLGVELRVVGAPSRARPTLYVCNHVSYLDITAIGSVLEACFVAKGEVASWPGIGWLARLQRTLFVARRRDAVAEQVAALRDRIAAGDNLVLFAEGTSTDGLTVRRFKPALFAALGDDVLVQPMWIAYRALDGPALDEGSRDRVAWHGDMTLAPHLLHLAGRRRVAAEIGFAPPFRASVFPNRKALATACESQVAKGLAAALAARPWWGGDPLPAADLNPANPGVILVK